MKRTVFMSFSILMVAMCSMQTSCSKDEETSTPETTNRVHELTMGEAPSEDTGVNNRSDDVVTGGCTDMAQTGITILGYVNHGSTANMGIEYDTDKDFSHPQREKASGYDANTNDRRFSVRLKNLISGKTYYYRAFMYLSEEEHIASDVYAFRTVLCPDDKHPHMIDMGLGDSWQCCNLGASKPAEFGGYYAWGELKQAEGFHYGPSKYDYVRIIEQGGWTDPLTGKMYVMTPIGDNISGDYQYDAATQSNSSLRMPTADEIDALIACQSYDYKMDGVFGKIINGPSGYGIFLPAAGYRSYSEIEDEKLCGFYWSGTIGAGDGWGAYCLAFGGHDIKKLTYFRFQGLSIRPLKYNW